MDSDFSYKIISSLFFETFLTVIYTKTTKSSQGQVATYIINQGKTIYNDKLIASVASIMRREGWKEKWEKQGGEKGR